MNLFLGGLNIYPILFTWCLLSGAKLVLLYRVTSVHLGDSNGIVELPSKWFGIDNTAQVFVCMKLWCVKMSQLNPEGNTILTMKFLPGESDCKRRGTVC